MGILQMFRTRNGGENDLIVCTTYECSNVNIPPSVLAAKRLNLLSCQARSLPKMMS